MQSINSIITFLMVCFASMAYCQDNQNDVFEINIDYGYSSDYGAGDIYPLNFGSGESVMVENRSPVRTRNYGVSYSRFFNSKNGLKISFGLVNYGFSINGRTSLTNDSFRGTYKIKYRDWGLSYVRRFPINQDYKILIVPGVSYLTDGSQQSDGISIIRKNAFSISLYSGIETLMVGHNFFANFGLIMKIPVTRHNYNFDDTRPAFYPYFIGLRMAVNTQS